MMKTNELKEIARENGYEYSFTFGKTILKREGSNFKNIISINEIFEGRVWIEITYYCDESDMRMMEASIAYAKTPPKEREEEKRYIVPLPGLTTTDGEQQYLTHKKGHFFASRRNKYLRQTWEEKNLCDLPEQYRIYAVEVEE